MKAYGPLSDIETTASVVFNTDSCIKCLIQGLLLSMPDTDTPAAAV